MLATIDAPALDAQFAASQANLAVVEARYKLAEITARDAGRRAFRGRRRCHSRMWT